MIITIAVSLSVLGSTTSEAAYVDEYPYTLYDAGTGIILLSPMPLKYGKQSIYSENYSTKYKIEVGAMEVNMVDTVANSSSISWTGWYFSNRTIQTGYILLPYTLNGETNYAVVTPSYAISYSTTSGGQVSSCNQLYLLNSYAAFTEVYANYTPDGIASSTAGSVKGELPEDIGGTSIDSIIDEALNAETDVSTQADATITNITNTYNLYLAGNITLEEAKAEVANQLENLNSVASSPTATLKDAVNVTNALTYGQTVNDVLLEDQNEAFWETRDIQSDVAQKVQTSDQAEIDYLESLISETEASISDLSPSQNFTAEQISTASEIVEGIWENPIVKKIIPVAACFMVICVALGVKYRL